MKSAEGPFLVLSLLILALGIGFAGSKVHDGLVEFRSYDNYVTVKGLALREVTADMAVWPIAHTVTGDDLNSVQTIVDKHEKEIIAFLKNNGVDVDVVERQQLQVVDMLAQSYNRGNPYENRFIVTQTLLVRSTDVVSVKTAAENLGDLIRKGISLAQTSGHGGPSYLFTGLNDIKPEMIAEATQNARDAAAQFAKDSGQKVGTIRRANQGLFQILPRDENYTIPESAQQSKTIRVVSTLDFYLE